MMTLTKRVRLITLFCLVAVLFAANMASEVQAQFTITGTVTVDQLFVRSAASRSGVVLDTLRAGQRMEISGRSSIRGWGYGRTEAARSVGLPCNIWNFPPMPT